MNSPFRVRLRARAPGFRLAPSPASRPSRSPPLSVWGCKSTSFFRTAKLFRKNFSKSFFPAAPVPSASLARPPRSRETGPQKYCFFTIRQTFFQEIFEKIFNPLTVSIKKTPEFSSIHPRNAAPDSKTHPAPHLAPTLPKTAIISPKIDTDTSRSTTFSYQKKARKTQKPPAPHNRQAVQPYFAIRIRASTATTCLALPNRGLISIS